MKVKYKGELLTTDELWDITDNFYLSYHARERIATRFPDLDVANAIRNPILAYYNTDGSMNIAINEYEYLVVIKTGNTYKVVTFKEKSHNNINIFKKREFALRGWDRVPYR